AAGDAGAGHGAGAVTVALDDHLRAPPEVGRHGRVGGELESAHVVRVAAGAHDPGPVHEAEPRLGRGEELDVRAVVEDVAAGRGADPAVDDAGDATDGPLIPGRDVQREPQQRE